VATSAAWPSNTPNSPLLPGRTTSSHSLESTSRSRVTRSSRRRPVGAEVGAFAMSSAQQLLAALDGFVDGADVEERLLGQLVPRAARDLTETFDGVLDLDVAARQTGELFRDE